jgi:chromosome partitioning protein
VRTLATYSIKGGVGKTTAAVNLAYEAAVTGARVLLWDIDPQGAATFFFRVRPVVKGGAERLIDQGALGPHVRATDHVGLHLVPADFSLRHLDVHLDDRKHPRRRLRALLAPLDDDYDVAIIDCPAGITLTSESVFAAAQVVLVPTIPTTLSKRTLDQLCGYLADETPAPQVAPFISMYDRRKRLQRELVAVLAAGRPAPLPTAIPNSSIVERMGLERAPIGSYAPGSAAAGAFRALWSDIAALLWP